VKIHFKAKMHQLPIIPLVSLAVASILLGLAYADAVLYSPAALMTCLTFTFATVLAYWIYCQPCSNKEAKDLTTGVGQGTSEKDETNEQNKPSFLSKLRFWEHPTSSGEKMEKHSDKFLAVSDNDDYNTALQDCHDKIATAEAAEKDLMKKLEPLSKETGVSKAKLRQWYADGDLQWRVQERRWTKLKLQVPRSGQVSEDGHPISKVPASFETSPDQITVLPKAFFDDSHPAKHPSHPHADVDERHPNKVPAPFETSPDQITVLPKTFFDDSHPAKHPSHPSGDADSHPDQVPADPNEKINCSEEILITGIASVLTTIILIAAFALIFKFFPGEVDQFWNAVKGYAENAKEDLKAEKEKAVEAAHTLWNQMSNYFSQMK
jgi:hypothetical protein